MTALNFNANEVEPAREFTLIPAGKYEAVISNSEQKATKAGTGQYLQLTFQIIEGEHKGRLLWVRLNLDNPNATAVKIARGELSAICRAVGVLQPQDSSELHDLPLVITVKTRKRKDDDELENVVRGYARKETPQIVQTAPAPAAANTPPWQRRSRDEVPF